MCQSVQKADSTTTFIGSQAYYGIILPHSGDIAGLAKGNPWGWQAEFSRIGHTQSSWNSCNCYSQNGFSLSYYNFDNPEVLGSSVNLMIFAEPQLTYSKVNIGVRGGMGLSYLTRVFHSDDNPENLFFSRPLSGLLTAQVNARFWLNEHWSLRISSAYNHISNGGLRQPNKGMNFPMVGLGAEYAFRPQPLRARPRRLLEDTSIQYYGGLFFNSRAIDETGLQTQLRKMVVGIQVGFYKPFTRLNAAGVALEISRDGALKERARQHNDSFDHHVVSGLFRHHVLFGRFDFSQALGVYLHKEYPTPHSVFQRYAIQYKALQQLAVGFSLKAHFHVAEQMDMRIMVVF